MFEKIVHTYIRIDFPKVENYEERNLPGKGSRQLSEIERRYDSWRVLISCAPNILDVPKFFFYLSRVGLKYWNNPVIIVERERYWRIGGA